MPKKTARKTRRKSPKKKMDIELDDMNRHDLALANPGMHIGSVTANKRNFYIYDANQKKVIKKDIMIANGLERLFMEIVANATDNSIRSRQVHVDPGEIIVTVDKTKVAVTNTGKPFVIEKYKKTGKYKQEVAFGQIGTSTNYVKTMRIWVGGQNGYGAKLANIYSNKFGLELVDATTGQKYEQTWTNHMYDKTEPKITKSSEKSYVKITYHADFTRFKGHSSYDDDIIGLFAFHCANFAYNCKIPITFNGVKFQFDNIVEYTKFVKGNDITLDNYIHHVEWGKNKSLTSFNSIAGSGGRGSRKSSPKSSSDPKDNGSPKSSSDLKSDGNGSPNGNSNLNSNPNSNPKNNLIPNDIKTTELLIYDSPDHGDVISFANAMYTFEGGIHVESIMEKIRDVVISNLNQKLIQKLGQKSKDNAKYRLTMRDLRPHVSIIVSCYVVDPDLTGQMKSQFNGPDPKIKLKKKDVEVMMKWDLVDRLNNTIKAKQLSLLTKGRTRKGLLYDGKGLDANKAGGKESLKCTLFITEGESASLYAAEMIRHLPDGVDYYGYFPLKGKPINAIKATIDQLNDNKEYNGFKKISGLREDVDYSPSGGEKNIKKARYGRFCILADSDIDGNHIKGLDLAKYHKIFKGLIESGRIEMIRTPIIRAFKGKGKNRKIEKFLMDHEYRKWADNTNTRGWVIKYYKGLGSSNNDDIKLDSEDIKKVDFVLDENSEKSINLAFGGGKGDSDARKKWIANYKKYEGIEKIKELSVSLFINSEVIEYSLANIIRSIPCVDGLKPVQRKILWTCLKRWGPKESLRTGDLINKTKNFTHYHHGDASIAESINKMTQEFPGSNNMAYLEPDGQFGVRFDGGKKCAAPRYTSVKKKGWWRNIFVPDDDVILEHTYEEEEVCEPKFMLPIIPLFLVNGAKGIGTGWSTFIPNYNPLDLCNYITKMIKRENLPKLIPWYKGFKGKIKVTVRIQTKKTNDKGEQIDAHIVKNVLEPDLVDHDTESAVKRRMVVTGLYRRFGPNKVVVDELPIWRKPKNYKTWLYDMAKDKKITGYKSSSIKNDVGFEIYGFKNPSIANLKLERIFGMTNMTIIDQTHKPRHFKTVKSLMVFWFNWRLGFYGLRLKKLIELRNNKRKELLDKRRFIEAVILGTVKGKIKGRSIVIMKMDALVVKEQMDYMKLDYELLDSVKTKSFTNQGLEKIDAALVDIAEDIKRYQRTKPEALWLEELGRFVTEYKKRLKKE